MNALQKLLAGMNQEKEESMMSVGEPAQTSEVEKVSETQEVNEKPDVTTPKVPREPSDSPEQDNQYDALKKMRDNISAYEQKIKGGEEKGSVWEQGKLQDTLSGLHNILNYASGSQQANLSTDAYSKNQKGKQDKKAKNLNQLQELQKLYSDYQAKTKKTKKDALTAYQKAQLDEKKADREQKLELAKLKSKGTSAKTSEFQKALEKKQAADFANSQEGLQNTATALSKVEDALQSQLDYTANSITGTGPIATLGGLTKNFSDDTEQLEAKFKEIDLKNMVSTFSGMSKAVDSDAERKAWKATQASISNDDKTNVQILLGSKSSLMKDKAIAEAKADWVSQNGNLTGFTHPILKGEVSTLVNPDGELVLINKKQFPDLKKAGFKTLDQHASQLISGDTSPEYVTMVAPNGQEATVKKDMIQKYLDKGAVIKE